MKFSSLKRAYILGFLMAFTNGPVLAAAPDAPIHLIVPTPPGSASDALARALAVSWGKVSGRGVVVENYPGAGTTIGSRKLAQAKNDGLTLGVLSANHTINPWLYKHLPYDPISDFTPIAMIGSVPSMLIANNRVPANTSAELAALSASSDKPLTEGVVTGTAYHLASEIYKEQAGVKADPIPYKGSMQVITDVVGGTIDFAFVAAQAGAPLVAAGKLKGLAVTSAARSEMAPSVPTLRESGLPNYNVDVWLAIAGPGGMSAAAIAARRQEIEAALKDPDMVQAMQHQSVQPMRMKQPDILPFIQAELERNEPIIHKLGLLAN